MTTPVKDDIVTGCVKWLRAKPDVVAAVDEFQIGGQLSPGIWGYRTWTRMEGGSKTAAVIAHDGGWATPNPHNTLRFPRIVLNIWADPVRDAQKNDVDPWVQRRANNTFEIIDKHLHRTGGPEVWWGSIRVVSCVRMTEPMRYPTSDGDGLIRLQAYYAVTEG